VVRLLAVTRMINTSADECDLTGDVQSTCVN
jgi:hypothetical protein